MEVSLPTEGARPTEGASEIDENHESWALDVLDKQYRLYAWNDTKMVALITIDGLLFAAVGFLYNNGISDVLALLIVFLTAVSVLVSLFFCLWHAIPKLRSGRAGSEPNRRTLYGITSHYGTWSEYMDAFAELDRNTFFRDTVRQIYGMATNNVRSERLLRNAAKFAYAGAVLFLLGMGAGALSARGIHPLGQWPAKNSIAKQAAQPTSRSQPSDRRPPKAAEKGDATQKQN